MSEYTGLKIGDLDDSNLQVGDLVILDRSFYSPRYASEACFQDIYIILDTRIRRHANGDECIKLYSQAQMREVYFPYRVLKIYVSKTGS